jgi:hypothetical protein
MFSDNTLQKLVGWSLVLFGLFWTIGSVRADWLNLQFNVEPFSLIAGAILVVAGFKTRRGTVHSAETGIGCMAIVLVLCCLWCVVAFLSSFDNGRDGGGLPLRIKWNGRGDLLTVVAVAAWAIINILLLKKLVRRAEVRAIEHRKVEVPSDFNS